MFALKLISNFFRLRVTIRKMWQGAHCPCNFFLLSFLRVFHFHLFLSTPSSVITLPLFLLTSLHFLPPIPPSPSLSVHLYMLLSLCWHVHRCSPVGSWPAPPLFCSRSCSPTPTPTFLLLILLLFFFPFCMCARVRGARHSVQPSGLKVNTYIIANCLQSLGAALKKDMLRRQLRPLAFASLSDRICFKGFARIIFNPRALCALWTMRETDRGYTIYAEFYNM